MWWMMLLVAALDSVTSSSAPQRPPISCEEARFRCAQRDGCGMTLENYMSGCSAVLRGMHGDHCPEVCKNSLIALTSTDEGQQLMSCKCSDEYCEDMKRRVEVCRPQVMIANMNETIVTCYVAHIICQADSSCSMAFDYYEHYCKAMLTGRKCTRRCLNSIDILTRQEKAAKLQNCVCAGRDAHECLRTRKNMERLCMKKLNKNKNKQKGKGGRKENNKNNQNKSNNETEVAKNETVTRITGDTDTNDFKTVQLSNLAVDRRMSYPVTVLLVVLILISGT